MNELLASLVRRIRHRRYLGKEPATVFQHIYAENAWQGSESISGRGSGLDQTERLRAELPNIFKSLSIKTLLDVPCGDFNWMQQVVPMVDGLKYIGGDIVEKLVVNNTEKYSSDNVTFLQIDLASDTLPQADLLFCRDCLVHLSFDVIDMILKNIMQSRVGFVALTTFSDHGRARDIRTGNWRPLNLELAPFNFPEPLIRLNEGCTEADGSLADKCVGIWRREDIRRIS